MICPLFKGFVVQQRLFAWSLRNNKLFYFFLGSDKLVLIYYYSLMSKFKDIISQFSVYLYPQVSFRYISPWIMFFLIIWFFFMITNLFKSTLDIISCCLNVFINPSSWYYLSLDCFKVYGPSIWNPCWQASLDFIGSVLEPF